MRLLKVEKAFTMIELLVVMAVIGVLASLAVSQFSAYKKNASDARIKSDLRNAATAQDVLYSDTQQYVSCADATACEGVLPGIQAFSNQTVISFTATNPTESFTGDVSCPNCNQAYSWDSANGGLQP